MIPNKKKYSIKEKIFAHFEIWRIYTVIWCGLVSLTGSCLATGDLPPMNITLLVTIIPIFGWISGLYLIDFIDRKLDIIQKSHRPIPSGRIKRNETIVVGTIFAVTGLILTLYLNILNILIIFIVAFLVFSYAKYTKSRGIIGNLNRGLVTVAAYFFGIFSLNIPLQSIPIYVWILSIVFFIHDTNSNMIGAIRDIKGDKKGGYMTLPVRYGIKKVGIISLLMTFSVYFIIFFVIIKYNFLSYEFYFIISLNFIIMITFYIYLFKSITRITRKAALNLHKFFVIERIILASAFIFGLVNIVISSIIFLISFLITIISQHFLRNRYEFKEIK